MRYFFYKNVFINRNFPHRELGCFLLGCFSCLLSHPVFLASVLDSLILTWLCHILCLRLPSPWGLLEGQCFSFPVRSYITTITKMILLSIFQQGW